MAGKKGITSKFTKDLHTRRMGDTPLPSLREALGDRDLREALRQKVSERSAERAEREKRFEQWSSRKAGTN